MVADGLEEQGRLRDDSRVLAGRTCSSCKPEGAKKCDADNEAQAGTYPVQDCDTEGDILKSCNGEIGLKLANQTANSTETISDAGEASCPPPTAAWVCSDTPAGMRWVATSTGVDCGTKSACRSTGEINQDPACTPPPGE